MKLFADCIYEKVPIKNLTLEDVETVAKIQIPKQKIFVENEKLFIESESFMTSRSEGFDADAEITIDKDNICFRTRVNVTSFIVYGLILLMIFGMAFYLMLEEDMYGRNSFSSGTWWHSFWLIPASLVAFPLGIKHLLHRSTKFLADNLISALKIYKNK